MKLFTSDELKENILVKSLSIGDSGKGKTHFIGSICDHGKPFVIDSESGLLTIADKKFDGCTVNTFTEFGEAIQYYMANYEEKGYTHLIVDSFTRLQQYLAVELSPEGKLTQNQWGEVLAKLRKVANFLTKDVPTHVHVTAMAMESKDDLTGAVKVFPNIQGSFKYDLAGYFDVVMYHECGEKEGNQVYWVQTQGDERITARSRLSSIGDMPKYAPNNYSIISGLLKKED